MNYPRIRNLTLCLFALVVLLIVNLSADARTVHQSVTLGPNDWPMYQHDPSHSGRTPATAYNDEPLYLQWAYSFGERVEVEAQPVTANGVIYQGVMNGEMHAINAYTGASIWIRRYGGPIPHTAAVDGNHVYYGSLDGKVYALAVSNGQKVWDFQTGAPVISAPAVVNSIVYIGSNDGNLYALDAANGQEKWHFSTGGPVISSPGVANGRVYFGSEDLYARAVDANDGQLIWDTKLAGSGMHNTHPVISDNGNVVIFVTIKPGASSYVPYEDYPNSPSDADPVVTWNSFYQEHPSYRYMYYLDSSDGDDLWNPSTRRYVPLPIPYWGLLHPILGPDGYAWFPAPAGTNGNRAELDHDDRLFKVNLATGEAFEVAGGSHPEFQARPDEVGRHAFSGNDYYYAISEDLAVYKPSEGSTTALFSNGDSSSYNFGTHMNPLSPLPSLHLWRYGGTVSMGGVPGASVPIIANGMIYYSSYSWLYAVGKTDHGYNPATSFPSRDARSYELTYLRENAPTASQIRAEMDTRIADILALGPDNPPVIARWEQPHKPLENNEFSFELYGYDADLVRTLSNAYPYLSASRKAQLKTYLDAVVSGQLLNPDDYVRDDLNIRCLIYGEPGIQSGDANCRAVGEIISRWYPWNPNLIGLRLYALWTFANVTGDWTLIQSNWGFISTQFRNTFLNSSYCHPVSGYGYCTFEEWRTGRLNVPAQIAAAQAVRDMAAHQGDTTLHNDAATFLATLLDARVSLADFVPHLYDIGELQPAPLRTNPDGTISNYDLMVNGPYNHDMIPYSAALRDRDTDPSQVNWWDGTTYRVDAGMDFMQYQALSGYFPLTYELTNRLRTSLLEKTRYYVKSYEVNSPWWWMADLAHHTTGSGEHLYHSPTLSWTMFQVKALVLQEDWVSLAHQLPEPVSFNYRYDLYRLDNLATLISLAEPDLDASSKTSPNMVPRTNDQVEYFVTIQSTGATFTETIQMMDVVPSGLNYISGSLTASRGTVNDNAAPTLQWQGTLDDTGKVIIHYRTTVTVPEGACQVITNTASITATGIPPVSKSVTIIANGYRFVLPIIRNKWIP
jgi:uncharacterized repeat protein (TIGR01451 family)